MDTIVRPPDSPPGVPAVTRPPRRWPGRVVVALVIFVLAAIVVAGAWISNYDPFAPGGRGWGPQDPRMRVTNVEALGASGQVFDLPVDGPTRFRYRFSITNDGPVPVTIRWIGPERGELQGEVKRRPVGVVEQEPVFTDGGSHELVFEPWHPFELRPAQQANIEIEVRFDPEICLNRGTRLSWWPELIHYSVFGIPRQATFESNLEVRIVGTEICPS